MFVIFLYSLHHDKNNPINSCLTPACVQVSHPFSSGMNQSINPCDDFYEFVCGRWIKTNIIPKGHSCWSTTKELSQKKIHYT